MAIEVIREESEFPTKACRGATGDDVNAYPRGAVK